MVQGSNLYKIGAALSDHGIAADHRRYFSFFRRYSSSSAWHLVLQNISPRETKYDLKRLTMNPETQARKKAHKTAL